MRRAFVGFVTLGLIVACAATPDLQYAIGGAEGGTSSGTSGTSGASGTTSGSSGGSGTSGASGSSGTSGTSGSSGTSGASGSSGSSGDAGSDAGDSGLPCPLVQEAGVQCCSSADRTCVTDSCSHCNDCQAANCKPNEYCCPVYNGGGNQYRGTVCKPDPGC